MIGKGKRSELDQIVRPRPSTWANYASSSLVIKVINEKSPSILYQRLCKNHYFERRKPWKMKFYNNAKTNDGFQGIENKLYFLANLTSTIMTFFKIA